MAVQRRDPRAEPDSPAESLAPHHEERPFDRASDSSHSRVSATRADAPLGPPTPVAAFERFVLGPPSSPNLAPEESPSTSQVRAITTPPASPAPDELVALAAAEPKPDATLPAMSPPARAGRTVDLVRVEHLVNEARWDELVAMLGPIDGADDLPAPVALVYALAHAETHPDDAGRDVALAIRAAARATELSEDSAVVRVIAKRLLRRSPVSWQKRRAPKRVSLVLVMIALILGGGGGFWLSTTKVRIPIPGITAR